MSDIPTRLYGCLHPLGTWVNARATMPDLFKSYALKRNVSDHRFIRAAKRLRVTSAFPFMLTGFTRNYLRFFRDINELEKTESRFFNRGISQAEVWGDDNTAAQAFIRRFSISDAWRINREQIVLSKSEHRVLEHVLEWIGNASKVDVPMENSLPATHPAQGNRWQTLARMLFALPQHVYDQVLPVIYGSGMAHRIPLTQKMKDVLNGIPGALARGSITETAHFVFHDPVRALYTIAKRAKGVEDPVKYTEIHLPAYVHALADPRLLIAVMQGLSANDKPLVPSFPRDGSWHALPTFLERFGFERMNVERWYWVVRALEPQVDQHLTIAFSARLRPFYELVAQESDTNEYFEDVMERLARHTGISEEDAESWLAWSYTMPLPVEHNVTSLKYRYHAMEGPRGAWGQMMRANTMTLEHIFDALRGRKKRPVKATTPWGQVLEAIVETTNGFFSRGFSTTEKKRRLRATLEELGYPNVATLREQFSEWQTDEDGARKVNIILGHLKRFKLVKKDEVGS